MRLMSIPKKHPFIFGVFITTMKTCSVDLAVQYYIEKKNSVDWKRNMTFGCFGMFYQGMWQYYLFNKIMPKITPNTLTFINKNLTDKIRDKKGIKGVLLQNFIENGINNPLLFFPCFYTIKESINREKICYKSIYYGLKTYKKNFWDDLKACWSIWIPAQTINFAFSPIHLRVPYVAFVSAVWTAYISYTRGGKN